MLLTRSLALHLVSDLFFSIPAHFLKGISPISLILAAIAGGFAGMLINYFSDVLPVTRRFSRPLCRECSQPYRLGEFLYFQRCSKCGTRTAARSIIVFAAAMICSVLIKIFPFSILGFWGTLPILVFLGAIMVIDIEHRVVLIQTSIFGLLLFFVYGLAMHGFIRTITGALAGFLILLLFYFLGMAFSKIVGKIRHQEIDEVAFGFGDVCAGTVFGLLAGWPAIIGAIIIAMLAYGVFSLFLFLGLLISKRYSAFTTTQPFTIFLILGLITVFYL